MTDVTKQDMKKSYEELAAFLLHQYKKKRRTKNK
jgi:hypothetical protein